MGLDTLLKVPMFTLTLVKMCLFRTGTEKQVKELEILWTQVSMSIGNPRSHISELLMQYYTHKTIMHLTANCSRFWGSTAVTSDSYARLSQPNYYLILNI